MTARPFAIALAAVSGSTIAALMAASTLSAAPAPTPQVVVQTRQANFKKMGGAMKALGDQLKSGAPAKPAMLAAAQTIAATAREQGRLFPPGTGSSAGVKNDALPAIWSDKAGFDGQMAKLVAESTKLVAAVNGGEIAAIQAQQRATGAVCGACHRQFRSDH